MNTYARAFEYPALAPAWAGPGPMGDENSGAPGPEEDERVERIAALEAQVASMTTMHARQLDQARRSARDLALRDAAAEHARKLQAENDRIANALAAFREERERYFQGVELEVVRLAMSVAAKVLHREAKMDPLLLSGAVHVVLQRLSAAGGVTMRVPANDAAAWEESLRLHCAGSPCPEVISDISLAAGDCVLHTHVGTVELGVSAQLEEIEKGFFDLLDRRPAPRKGV